MTATMPYMHNMLSTLCSVPTVCVQLHTLSWGMQNREKTPPYESRLLMSILPKCVSHWLVMHRLES